MHKSLTSRDSIKLIGIASRTNNQAEMRGENAVIPSTIQEFYTQGFAQAITSTKPDTTYHIYTEYDSNENGDYTFFVGKEVRDFQDIPAGCRTLEIPAQSYAVFTNSAGPMPAVCIDMWKRIWTMNEADFGGKRTYIADFEIYDGRSQDPLHTVLDIYVGIHKQT